MKKFCWVTFRINNEIVEAKRLKIFTGGDKIMDTDSDSTVHVGYCNDVPGNEDVSSDVPIMPSHNAYTNITNPCTD